VDSDDPAVKAMRKLDWETFMASLDQRARTLIEWRGEGRTLTSLADHWRVSLSRVMQWMVPPLPVVFRCPALSIN